LLKKAVPEGEGLAKSGVTPILILQSFSWEKYVDLPVFEILKSKIKL
jgi:hypothetical protein